MDIADYFRSVDEAAAWLKTRIAIEPRAVVVLSAGLQGFAETLSGRRDIPLNEIPHIPAAKAQGHEGVIAFGALGEAKVAAMIGRLHFYEGLTPQEVVFPHFVLAKLGATHLVTTNAAGAVNPSLRPGDIMLISDHINMMGSNPLVGIAALRRQRQFTDMGNAYDKGLRRLAMAVARRRGIELKEGVYLAVSGPSYETPAEIRAFRKLGADAVGMSTVPEVIAANFLGLKVLSLSCITNAAADSGKGTLAHAEVLREMAGAAPKMISLLDGVVRELPAG